MTNKHLFLIKYSDGGISVKELEVTKTGIITTKSRSSLSYQGYTSFCDLTNTLLQATNYELWSLAKLVELN